jgi:hypothetical protein
MTTIHTRQLQQNTRPINNNYTQDNLKLATIHTRQINTVGKCEGKGKGNLVNKNTAVGDTG